MASIAEINVRIGARIDQMVKGLNKAERRLQRSSRKLQQLGSQMTTAISLPILGIGAAAIKSAGDMEQLENGLTSIMGDAQAAAKELELLKEAAQNPGLGFTQAVKGSVRLQSVGLGAETARKALLNFGNAIALAGGSATDLDGVSLALTQIISKGKISAEEINQLAERVPQVRKAIKDGFGTSDSEELQKLGISAEEFVEKVIDEMGKLPQATGGIKNAITNAGIAIQVFLSDLGKDIDKTFNVQGMVKNFSESLQNLSNRFKNLDASTKKTVLQFAALVVAVGPAIKVFATLKNVYAGVISASSTLLVALKNTSGAVLSAVASFQKLNTVMKLSVIGAVVTAATAAVMIFQKWNNTLSDTEKIKRTITDINTKAAQSIVTEKREVTQLIDVLKDETAEREDKKTALEELKRISPKYFGDLDLEKTKVEDLTLAMDGYIDNLVRSAKVRAANAKMDSIAEELEDEMGMIRKLKPEYNDLEAIKIRATTLPGAGRTAAFEKLWTDRVVAYRKSLEEQLKATAEYVAKEGVLINTKRPAKKKKKKKKETEKQERAKIEIIDIDSLQEQEEAQNKLFSSLVENLINTEFYQNRLKEQTNAAKVSNDEFLNGMATTPEHFEKMRAGIESLRVEMEQLEEQEKRFNEMMESAKAAGDAIAAYAKQGGDSLKELGKVALKSAADFVRGEMMKAVSSYISSVITTAGPLGLILAGAGSAIVGTLFNKAITSLKVPALAQGGLAYSPTLAMVGDNTNASVDPEVIAPLSKLKNIMGGSSSGGNMVLTHRISGGDLLMILKNANMNEQRTTGSPAFVTG